MASTGGHCEPEAGRPATNGAQPAPAGSTDGGAQRSPAAAHHNGLPGTPGASNGGAPPPPPTVSSLNAGGLFEMDVVGRVVCHRCTQDVGRGDAGAMLAHAAACPALSFAAPPPSPAVPGPTAVSAPSPAVSAAPPAVGAGAGAAVGVGGGSACRFCGLRVVRTPELLSFREHLRVCPKAPGGAGAAAAPLRVPWRARCGVVPRHPLPPEVANWTGGLRDDTGRPAPRSPRRSPRTGSGSHHRRSAKAARSTRQRASAARSETEPEAGEDSDDVDMEASTGAAVDPAILAGPTFGDDRILLDAHVDSPVLGSIECRRTIRNNFRPVPQSNAHRGASLCTHCGVTIKTQRWRGLVSHLGSCKSVPSAARRKLDRLYVDNMAAARPTYVAASLRPAHGSGLCGCGCGCGYGCGCGCGCVAVWLYCCGGGCGYITVAVAALL